MITDIPAEQFASAVDQIAEELLVEAGISEPPIDCRLLAKRLGLVVARDSEMQVRARFVKLSTTESSKRGTILLADDPRPERRHWALAHEVGEYSAYRLFTLLGIPLVDIPSGAREQVANRLANALLLPRSWFADWGSRLNWDLLELKKVFSSASHELIVRRMLEMSPAVIITLFDQGALQWRRSNRLNRPPRLTAEESETWRTTFELAEPAVCLPPDLPEGIGEVRCWPVHEPGWRREILRTQLEEW